MKFNNKLNSKLFLICSFIFLICLCCSLYAILYHGFILLTGLIILIIICFTLAAVVEFKSFLYANTYIDEMNKITRNLHDVNSHSSDDKDITINKSSKLAQSILTIDLSNLKDEKYKKHIIICKGYNSAIDCSIFLNNNGYKWYSGDSYTDNCGWITDENYIGYLFNAGTFIRFNNFNEVNWDDYIVHFWVDKSEV